MRTYRTILDMLLALRRLRRREAWTRPQIEAHQSDALARLRAHAYAHSPFYQEFHAGLEDRPLDELPVLKKSMLHEHFNEIVTDPSIDHAAVASHAPSIQGDERFRGHYIVNATSGTTGEPSYILFNHAEWIKVLASFSRFERHVGSLQGTIQRPKIAIVGSSTPWHISARVGASVRSSWIPILRIDVGTPLDSIVQQLNDWQPRVLVTYASMAGILAGEQRSGRLQIAPQRIVSTAEVLSPALRQRIQAVWGDVVYNQYGATEGGIFAAECTSYPHGSNDPDRHTRGLHLFEDLFILEVVDEHNNPAPPGEYGDKVLLTVLFNYTQPLIRYELSDKVRLATEPCSCGCELLLIDGIQGRREDVLSFPARQGGTVAVHPMVFYRILDATPAAGWQVVQDSRSSLVLRLNGAGDQVHEPSLVGAVSDALEQLNAVVPAIAVERTPKLERNTTGKAKRIISCL
ncbi:MAG TPA: AMP-binding protein [Candidatus Sulfomarinibacteraceae bacterium]|nr:AMP-binding protein [Candidatus Sulfomarinibacteraceae bacterium]